MRLNVHRTRRAAMIAGRPAALRPARLRVAIRGVLLARPAPTTVARPLRTTAEAVVAVAGTNRTKPTKEMRRATKPAKPKDYQRLLTAASEVVMRTRCGSLAMQGRSGQPE